MDSSGLNPPPFDDDAVLRAHFEAAPPLADNGFSSRVVSALPAPRAWNWRAATILGIASALGLAGVYLTGGRVSDLATLADQAIGYVSSPGLLLLGGVILAAWVLSGGAEDTVID